MARAAGLPENPVTAWLRSVAVATEYVESNGPQTVENYISELTAVHFRVWGDAITSFAQIWNVWQGEVVRLDTQKGGTPSWQKPQLAGPRVVPLFGTV